MATPVTPTPPDTLSPEQRANRQLAASLLDARSNLARTLKQAESRIEAAQDQAIKDFGKTTTPEQVIVRARVLSAAIEQARQDIAALKEAPKIIEDRLRRLEKESPDDVLAVYIERKAKVTAELATKESDRKPLEEEEQRLEREIAKLTSSKTSPTKKRRGTTSGKDTAKTPGSTGLESVKP